MSHRVFTTIRLLAFFVLLSGPVTASAAGVSVDAATKNFGQVAQGATVTTTFVLKNTGDNVLHIQRMQVSMPGMQVRVKQDIAPGMSADATISWDTSGFSGEANGQAMLFLNDPAVPQLLLTLEGKVVAPVEVLPMPAFYLSQFQGETRSQRRQVRNNTPESLVITRLEPHGSHFRAELESVTPGKEYAIQVTVPTSVPAGRYRESLVLGYQQLRPAQNQHGSECAGQARCLSDAGCGGFRPP